MMLTAIHPKLPMRSMEITKAFYIDQLGFKTFNESFEGYLMIYKDEIEIHFFEFKDLIPEENYGQIYIRTNNIEELYQNYIDNSVKIHPNGSLQLKPWGIKEFSILDPDSNLITFGESL